MDVFIHVRRQLEEEVLIAKLSAQKNMLITKLNISTNI